ncbi:right-handed parallel beta-helix repeat-containing protein [Anaerocolumna xylanovorans]|uniref:Right handed beta helix region n=1 Tax=Anaerocolumna xylanovorans DSM 12503 TaxID=1121345 RepID=A0A1M7YMD5_9FIRM|nr:right-handed parallel beta-helix repeat-containing protein [Anaerocolumna xylanovorans]SHO53706.1 Right handed beta helix region [Anaerocolumna xylanovorans DSM 12503]
METSIIKLKKGTTFEWKNSTKILSVNECGIEETSDGKLLLKLGDGLNKFDSLPFVQDPYRNVKVVGFDKKIADYICDGIRDDAELQKAIDDLDIAKGGSIYVMAGEYHYSKAVRLKSNIKIEFNKNAKIKMDDQILSIITSDVNVGNTTVSISPNDINKFQIGMEIGFIPDNVLGYRAGEDACVITDIKDNIITFSISATKHHLENVTKIVSLNSCLVAVDTVTTTLHDIEIIGGNFDGNRINNPIWVRDMHQNGIITGGVHNLKIKDVKIHSFNFQNIHVSGTILNGNNIGTVIENCISYDSSASGITLDTIPEEVCIINCISYGNGNSGLQLVDVDKCTIIGGYYNDNSFCGIRSAHDDIPVTENKFIGVTAVRNGRGFGIRNNSGTIISGCSTKDNKEAGIYLEEDCIGVQISSCLLESEAVGIKELEIGTSKNVIFNPIFINCITNYSLSNAGLLGITDGMFNSNKVGKFNRIISDSINNQFQFAENGRTKWHAESVGGIFNLVESGVLERLIIAGNETNLQSNFKTRKFGCNGKESQGSVTVNPELPTNITTVDADTLNRTNALLNQIRSTLINCGICS